MNLTVIIMCGGSGTRLWPLSRKNLPKQFIKLNDEFNLFQLTINRMMLFNPKKIIIISNKSFDFLIKKNMEELNIKDYLLINEPFRKDTAAAIGLCLHLCSDTDNLLIASSDHIWDDNKFKTCVTESYKYINNHFIFFGIKPTTPETGFGYLKITENNDLLKFVEKPDIDTAKEYLNNGLYLWNSGNFLVNTKLLKSEYVKNAPEIYEQTGLVIKNSIINNNIIDINKESFQKIEPISIDYAIMEKYKDGKCVIYDGIWNDIGSFKTLYDISNKDINSNTLYPNSELLDCKNCYINSDNNKLITGINLQNLCIIDNRDCLLISNMDDCQKIKTLVKNIENDTNKKPILDFHSKVFRPWGWYINIDGNDNSHYKIKKIGVYPGKRLSLQSHNQRSEHWVIISGNVKVQVGKDFHILHKNQHVYIPIGVLHRIENIGNDIAEFIETQVGEYLGEDDIVRYQDDFGRC